MSLENPFSTMLWCLLQLDQGCRMRPTSHPGQVHLQGDIQIFVGCMDDFFLPFFLVLTQALF